MFQAHSVLWHYLWIAPSLLLLILVVGFWRLRIHKQHPFFVAFALASAVEQLVLYVLDLVPSVSALSWWRFFWVGLSVEGILKFLLVGEIFAHVFQPYSALAKLGKRLIGGSGIILVFAAAFAAAIAPADSAFGIVSGAHVLEQSVYIIECGLLASMFALTAYFHIRMPHRDAFIALGLGISACVHLGTWAVAANNALPPEGRLVLDVINMATFHVCVVIWLYVLLRAKAAAPAIINLPENNLALWNRELERLLQ